MIHKLAALVVEKADGTAIATPGEKGEIITAGKALIHKTNLEASHDIFRVTIFGTSGIIKERRWKANTPAASAAPVVVDDAGEEVPPEQEADAAAIRAALKAKGVNVPPRIGVDKLLALAVERGVEV